MALRISEAEYRKITGKKDQTTPRKNKYHSNKITVNGIRYDSTKEYERHCDLILLEKNGDISNLRFHSKEDKIILIDDPKVTYEPDFCYDEDGKHIVEDFKGMQTKEFILKKKMIISQIRKGTLKASFRITKYDHGNFVTVEEYS